MGTGITAMRPNAMTGPAIGVSRQESPFDEVHLLERCRRGDTAAFGRLVAEYQDRVFNTCWRMCGNWTDAEDLTQEAFVRAFQSLDRFAGRSRFYTWVFRIAVNLALSARRRDKLVGRYSLDAPRADPRSDDHPPMNRQLAAVDESPDSRTADREEETLVLEALNRLDEEHRAVVVLRDLESMGYEEIAGILDIPVGTVKSRLHRARLALREMLAPLFADRRTEES